MRRYSSAVAVLLMLATQISWADNTSPAGLWKTIDDQTGKPKSLIRISEHDGEFQGRIEKLFREQGQEQNPRCDKCTDNRKGQPIVGLVILTGMKSTGTAYGGGRILDPANGKVYKSKMTLTESGNKLEVRGYIGVPMFGRSQTWLRVE